MNNSITKEDWVALFREIGLDEATMLQWHRAFERKHPEAHQAFLEWLQIPTAELNAIREKSA